MKFLGDEETVRKAIESVAAQGKAKWMPRGFLACTKQTPSTLPQMLLKGYTSLKIWLFIKFKS